MRFSENPAPEEKKAGGFFANLGTDTAWTPAEMPQFAEQEIKTEPDPKYTKKESCWNCYKLFPEVEGFKDGGDKGHSFCSQGCYDKHVSKNSIKCELGGCPNNFLKVKGAFVHGKWFCSENCASKDPETQKIAELYKHGIEFENAPPDEEDDDNYAKDEDIEL